MAVLDIANIPKNFSLYRHRVAGLDVANIPKYLVSIGIEWLCWI